VQLGCVDVNDSSSALPILVATAPNRIGPGVGDEHQEFIAPGTRNGVDLTNGGGQPARHLVSS